MASRCSTCQLSLCALCLSKALAGEEQCGLAEGEGNMQHQLCLVCLSQCRDKAIQDVASGAFCKREVFYPILVWFCWHIVFSSKPSTKAHHCLTCRKEPFRGSRTSLTLFIFFPGSSWLTCSIQKICCLSRKSSSTTLELAVGSGSC